MIALPKLIGFAIDKIHIAVWCPYCASWHRHGYDDEERRRWTHRNSHCHYTENFPHADAFPDGYLIKLASKKDLRGIARGNASHSS